MRTRVKICGITRPEDGLAAARHGADAIGLMFYPPSPRAVDPDTARNIVQVLPPFVSVVAVFVDATPAQIQEVLGAVPVDLLQFHGSESPVQCAAPGRPYIKAVAMRAGLDLAEVADQYAGARGLLVDTHRPGVHGGTGEVFDWGRIPPGPAKPIVLAGGLDPDNVAEAVRQVRPYGVDVSSGVERDKGIKDEDRIAAFMRGVMRGQSQ
ncbi:MAG: phosphoribosylanthranilate isomerase [Gammaproteobacteria bacterium]|nr:phosphoribosylanthranilate isomerase [Gammaproteobacteria bacterium]NIR96945.1 phosphoribosylanthranilate isomerase [Gammaproteobacteria bacterium]NIT62647.1 phosphoribosylanthranilate isomerase [Gammaproteobacteria bacterium]NIV19607.1 phosphoribosylanthranilate isomerase [Gammaproteobacteria bacterium]NIX10827.1 phosphoribosylanthranilate isomerase [Gammaproteobacteria bacterium]